MTLTNSLKRGLQVLEAFTPSFPRMRLQDVVRKTGIPKVTALRFLRTFVSLRYISYDTETKLYSLSPRTMSLGYTALSSMDVREIAVPYLEQLSESTGQNVNLGILDGIEVIYVERIKKKQILNIDLNVGSRLNIYNSSIGQVILAFMEKSECERIVEELLGDPNITMLAGANGELLYKKLDDVRKHGYALNDEAYVSGVRAIGAPVFNHKGKVDAGINIPVFSHMVSRDELIQKYLPLLLKTTERLSAARGFLQRSEGKIVTMKKSI